MGNWTTIHISGTCGKDDLPALSKAVNAYKNNDDWNQFHCLCNTGGLCGLGDWPRETISAIGNLAERDYGVKSVAGQLKELLKVAPSLNVKVHVGGNYESLDCVATVICADGAVNVGEPEIKTLPSIPEGQLQDNLIRELIKRER